VSRPYRIRVAETVRQHVVVEDGVECGLEILALLPPEEQTQLLAEELTGRGFEVDGGVARRTESDGVVVTVDLERARVRVGKTVEREVERTAQRTFSSETNTSATVDQVREVRAAAEREIERERERTRQEATADIEGRLGDLRAELDEIAVRVTQVALRKKASRMGEVESIEEDPATGSLTIRVRV
jgi:hypothetical protein